MIPIVDLDSRERNGAPRGAQHGRKAGHSGKKDNLAAKRDKHLCQE
jgi:hypothetical protein